MLGFLRKYQRYFFLFIALVIGVSFMFFGTHQASAPARKVDDRPLGASIDGSSMRKRAIDEIVRFIETDRQDTQLMEKRKVPNFFNDGVVRKDFLETGLGLALADHYFDALKGEIEERFIKQREFFQWRDSNPNLATSRALLEKFFPKQKESLDTFLKEDLPIEPKLLPLLMDLYLGEMALPPHFMRQSPMFGKDQSAREESAFSPFTCLEDWFGPSFLQLVGQFIHNAALFAKQQGYHVSFEEAKVDLFRNGVHAFQMQRSLPLDQAEMSSLWNRQLAYFGMDEKAAVTVWQKVMLFRRLFNDCGHAALIDSHPYQCFHSHASKTAVVDHYSLEDKSGLSNFEELLKFLYYVDVVSASKCLWPALPEEFLPIEQLQKVCPKLVCRRFLVEMKRVTVKEIAQEVSLKQMWEWQLDSQNFKKLQKAFPELGISKASDAEGYFNELEKHPPYLRRKIDDHSLMQIAKEHPEWIIAALGEKEAELKQVAFSIDGAQGELEGIGSGEGLLKLFEKAPLKKSAYLAGKNLEVQSELELFSSDQQNYYYFQVVDRDEKWHISTFKEANDQGVLNPLFKQYLQEQYPKVRQENPSLFKTTSDEWKPFEEVRGEVALILYRELFDAIDHDQPQTAPSLAESRFKKLDSFYPKNYFLGYMKRALLDIRAKGEKSDYLFTKVPSSSPESELPVRLPFEKQWKITKRTKEHKNCESKQEFEKSLFSMSEKEWSSVHVFEGGEAGFFQLQKIETPEQLRLQEVRQGHEILFNEAKRFLMLDFLDRFKEKECVHLSPSKRDVE